MGIFDRLERPTAVRASGWSPLDDRWYAPVDHFWDTFSGFPIGPAAAMRVSAVFACTSLIAETLASLPCILYRRLDDGGKEKAKDHRLYRTLRTQPNRRMTPMDYYGGQQMHCGLRGKAIAEIRDDGTRVELLPINPDFVTTELLTTGRYRYIVRDPQTAETRTLLQERVLHVRDLSTDGVDGMSRTTLAREAIAVAAAGEAFVGGFFRNDATGRLLITHPAALDETKRKEMRTMLQENYAGWAQASKTMLLTNGVTATELGQRADSNFIVDPRRFQVADIARFWRVPLFMIGLEEKSTTWGTGVEQQKQGFVDFTIKSWTDRHAQAMQLALLDEQEQEEYFIEFLFADLVRGDLLTRMQAYKIGREIGVYSPNKILEKENENLRDDPGGDEYQSTPAGAAPNQPGQPAGPAAPDQPPGQAFVPAALLADAVRRIAGRELDDVAKAAKATDPSRWAAWVTKYYVAQRKYAEQVLTPLAVAYGFPELVVLDACAQVEHSGHELRHARATPERLRSWLTYRSVAVRDILQAVFTRNGNGGAA